MDIIANVVCLWKTRMESMGAMNRQWSSFPTFSSLRMQQPVHLVAHVPFSNGPLLKGSLHFFLFRPHPSSRYLANIFGTLFQASFMLCTKILFVINFSTGQSEMMKTYLEIMSIISILKQFANLGRLRRIINYFLDFSFLGQLAKFRASTPPTENPRSATLFDCHKMI